MNKGQRPVRIDHVHPEGRLLRTCQVGLPCPLVEPGPLALEAVGPFTAGCARKADIGGNIEEQRLVGL